MHPASPSITALVSAVLIAGPAGRHATRGPCYAAFTAVVIDSGTHAIRRIVTSGVLRFHDASNGASPRCVPDDAVRLADAEHAVRDRLKESGEKRIVEFVDVRDTEPQNVGGHLARIARFAAIREKTLGGIDGIEVVHLIRKIGRDADSVALPRIASSDSARARCDSTNARLARESARYHWAC
jgi:hypothetical protein